ncbi:MULTISPECIES: transposase [Sorangium]|uniref:transposase n=1 Tax=Sorangium sp. So ce836 TaxID=2969250 RepID=UPI0013EA7ADC|nr:MULTISPECIES: transposase [Sorangium]
MTRPGETELPQAAETERLDGTALVLGYLQARGQGQGSPADPASVVDALLRRVQELEAKLAELSTAEQQAQELARSVESLKAYNQQLQETIRTLEIGFRRHVSEQISPDQLRLSLAGEPDACPAQASSQAETHSASPEADRSDGSIPPPGLASPAERGGTAESCSSSDPGGGKRVQRHEHGRRRIGVIPRVIIETLPPEVLLQGMVLPRFRRHPRRHQEAGMGRRKRRAFTPEFKAEAVRLAKASDRSIGQVAKDLDLTETALRDWIKRADTDAGHGPPGALTTPEREELQRLRRDVKRLEMEREILKKRACAGAHPRSMKAGRLRARIASGQGRRLLVS